MTGCRCKEQAIGYRKVLGNGAGDVLAAELEVKDAALLFRSDREVDGIGPGFLYDYGVWREKTFATFKECFGDLEKLELEWRRYMRDLKTSDELLAEKL